MSPPLAILARHAGADSSDEMYVHLRANLSGGGTYSHTDVLRGHLAHVAFLVGASMQKRGPARSTGIRITTAALALARDLWPSLGARC